MKARRGNCDCVFTILRKYDKKLTGMHKLPEIPSRKSGKFRPRPTTACQHSAATNLVLKKIVIASFAKQNSVSRALPCGAAMNLVRKIRPRKTA